MYEYDLFSHTTMALGLSPAEVRNRDRLCRLEGAAMTAGNIQITLIANMLHSRDKLFPPALKCIVRLYSLTRCARQGDPQVLSAKHGRVDAQQQARHWNCELPMHMGIWERQIAQSRQSCKPIAGYTEILPRNVKGTACIASQVSQAWPGKRPGRVGWSDIHRCLDISSP
jgi:hypothetical protein